MSGSYTTNVTDPAAFDDALERAKQFTYRRTCSLLASSPGKLEHIASCVLVRAEHQTLAVTAAHALDVIHRLGAVPALGGCGDAASPVLVLPFEFAESVAPRGDRDRDGVDVAALPVPGDVASLGGGHEVVELGEIDTHYEPAAGDVVVVHGFPTERAREFRAGEMPGVRAESAFFSSSPSPELPRKARPKDGSRAPSFALRYDRSPPVRVGMTGKAPHPEGLSGSGAWLLGRTDPRTGVWKPLDRTPLVGIVQSWPRPTKDALVVTRADALAPCLWLCPGARDAALRAFPELAKMRPVGAPRR